jgi:uncharacterized protein YecE (DUF72 family)
MTVEPSQFVIGTSGYSFEDWVGTYYPAGTRTRDMFDHYARHFQAVELNFTFYAMPFPRTLESLAKRSPEGFEFWLKANREITHKGNLSVCEEFIANLSPLCGAGKLAGVLLQFPQSFHRTASSRRFLADAIDRLRAVRLAVGGDSARRPSLAAASGGGDQGWSPPTKNPAETPTTPKTEGVRLAVEFRHRSWEDPAALAGLRERNVALVVPDEPPLEGLFHPPPTATADIAYLRLHSRDAAKWYAGMADRYDYFYSDSELREVLAAWSNLPEPVDKVYTFFNNCHRGQAAMNAEAFRKILGQL